MKWDPWELSSFTSTPQPAALERNRASHGTAVCIDGWRLRWAWRPQRPLAGLVVSHVLQTGTVRTCSERGRRHRAVRETLEDWFDLREAKVPETPKHDEIWAYRSDIEDHPGLITGSFSTQDLGEENGIRYVHADLVPTWQPIETAPKDGTNILLCDGDAGDSPQFTGHWVADEQAWWGWESECEMLAFCPSHWKPLSEPPTTDQGR